MFGKKKTRNKLVIDSLLDAKTVIQGNVSFCSGMQIEGQVKGDVKGAGPDCVLVIGKNAVIEGGVEAAHIYIDGVVIGPVKGSTLVVVRPHGQVTGDVFYGRIQMEEGSRIKGQLLPVPAAQLEPMLDDGPKNISKPLHSKVAHGVVPPTSSQGQQAQPA